MGLDIWNPWHGCRKISPGCRNCYMYAMDAYRGRPEWSGRTFRTGKFRLPLKKSRNGEYKIKSGQRIRVNMTSDTFIEDAEPWLPEFWDIIRRRPDVVFYILTKRPERIMGSLPGDWRAGYENVSLNITAENQDMFDVRWPVFASVPARHKGICCAPLLGPIDIVPALSSGQLELVQAGGENYDMPRPCRYEWVTSLSKQCLDWRVNFNWYESGTRFVYNGLEYVWPKKTDQSAIAYFSKQNLRFYEPRYILKSPEDGHVLGPDELYEKKYNADRCVFCAGRMTCNGCLSCGDCCRPPRFVDLETLWGIEDAALASDPPRTYRAYVRKDTR